MLNFLLEKFLRAGLLGEWVLQKHTQKGMTFILFPVLHDYAESEIVCLFKAETKKGYLPVPIFVWFNFLWLTCCKWSALMEFPWVIRKLLL